MPTYNTSVTRDSSDDPLVPTPVAAQIIQELPTASAVMARAMKAPMSTKSNRQPVLSVLPQAYFVNGDTGMKQTTAQDWANLTLVAEEMACIVPIPEAYLDDAQVPIWNEVRPRIVEAMGALLDGATLFGTNKPSTWGDAIVDEAANGVGRADHQVTAGSGDDLGQDVAALALALRRDGFRANGFVSAPGFTWELVGMRTSQGVPLYQPNLKEGVDTSGVLYGYPLSESENAAWDDVGSDGAKLIVGDWRKAILGTRQDISFRIFTEGVISDDAGNIVLNLMQQDAVALRCTARFGWAVANPVTARESNAANRYPFAVLRPAV